MRDAVLDTTAALVAEQGLRSVTMSRIAEVVTADELSSYCLHALSAAGGLASKAAVGRLVTVTLDGLRPSR
ncbi:hypothetical protein [Streptomyces jeddahensis]|uniref:hypothetical protein n=1 Tax=Streptomyces jeddahensis TaxID=1716141 RepID=UPI000829913D|nr:hypothetical protein [Streptomyces jeddahensis]